MNYWRGMVRLCLVLVIGITGGCATLTKDECLNANWYSIGFEDGVKGRSANWQAKHRQTCAEFNVTIDVDRYLEGRRKGLRQYCVPKNGYWVGRSGYRYTGVCSSTREPAFLDAYNYGRNIYRLIRKRDRLLQQIKTLRYDLDNYENRILEIENRLVKETLNEHQKRALLDKIRLIQTDRQNGISQLEHMLYDAGLMDAELSQLDRNNPYTF